MKIITGNANPKLAQEIAEHCFATLVPAKVSTFADGESSVEFLENIRGEDVFIIQSTATPVNDTLCDCTKRTLKWKGSVRQHCLFS
jgi:ribose-phosphate pyrophosphokinase